MSWIATLLLLLSFASDSWAAALYYYKDEQGDIYAADLPEMLPEQFRAKAKPLELNLSTTDGIDPTRMPATASEVSVSLSRMGNTLLVPVNISKVPTMMVLDTNAPTTVISSKVAHQAGLAIQENSAAATAPGPIPTRTTLVPSISVKGLLVPNMNVTIYDVPTIGAEGVLGLDYLKNFKFELDSQNGILKLQRR